MPKRKINLSPKLSANWSSGDSKKFDPIRDLLNEREKTHGSFDVHAAVTQRMKFIVRGYVKWIDLSDCQREAVDMILHKIGRVMAGDSSFKDHWDDIAGYAKLVADRCPKSQ